MISINKKIEYKTVTNKSLSRLKEEFCGLMPYGWKPYGIPCYTDLYDENMGWSITMIRFIIKDEEYDYI